jgi:hypothetical protein
MMMNQGAMMGNGLGFPAAMNMGQNGMANNAGAGVAGLAPGNPPAGAALNGAGVNPNANPNANASSRPAKSAKSKATKSRTKTTKKR